MAPFPETQIEVDLQVPREARHLLEKTRTEYHFANGDRIIHTVRETTTETGPVLEKSREIETFSGEAGEKEKKTSWRGGVTEREGGYVEGRKAVKDERKVKQGVQHCRKGHC